MFIASLAFSLLGDMMFAVAAYSCTTGVYCYKFLHSGFSIVPSYFSIWHIYRMGLPQILAKETRNETEGRSK